MTINSNDEFERRKEYYRTIPKDIRLVLCAWELADAMKSFAESDLFSGAMHLILATVAGDVDNKMNKEEDVVEQEANQ